MKNEINKFDDVGKNFNGHIKTNMEFKLLFLHRFNLHIIFCLRYAFFKLRIWTRTRTLFREISKHIVSLITLIRMQIYIGLINVNYFIILNGNTSNRLMVLMFKDINSAFFFPIDTCNKSAYKPTLFFWFIAKVDRIPIWRLFSWYFC